MSATVRSVEDLTELYGKRIAPLHMPIRENEKFVGYINVVKNSRPPITSKKTEEKNVRFRNIPNEYLEKYREILLEAVAETSEEFMDRYFAGEEFSVTRDFCSIIAVCVGDGSLVPVCHGISGQPAGC